MYKKLPYFPSQEDVDKIFETLRNRQIKNKGADYNLWLKARDKLILYFGFYMGLRIREVSGISLSNINLSNKTIKITTEFAKFGKERILPIPKIIWIHLIFFIKHYHLLFDNGFILTTSKGKRMTTWGIRSMFKKLLKKADLFEYYMIPDENHKQFRAKIHFHSSRHYCATRIYDKTKDPFAVSIWLGHKSPESSWVYVHESLERKREIMNEVFSSK